MVEGGEQMQGQGAKFYFLTQTVVILKSSLYDGSVKYMIVSCTCDSSHLIQ